MGLPVESEAGCSSGQGLYTQSASRAGLTCQHHAWDGYAASHQAVREIPNEDEP